MKIAINTLIFSPEINPIRLHQPLSHLWVINSPGLFSSPHHVTKHTEIMVIHEHEIVCESYITQGLVLRGAQHMGW